MSLNVSLRDLLEAGVHFGHQKSRWNPKMKRFIFEQRNGIHVIDLQSTMVHLATAYDFVQPLAARGQQILFLGTKTQAKELVKEAALRCGMYYVNERWLGGLLTNFVTIRKSVAHYKKIQSMMDDGSIEKIPGKEASGMRREWTKMHRNLDGIKDMEVLPAAVFVVDPQREGIAVSEARKMHVSVVAIADTNCDPDLLDYPIPGNDDAIRTIKLLTDLIADAVLEGKNQIVAAPTPPVASAVAQQQEQTSAEQGAAKAGHVRKSIKTASVKTPAAKKQPQKKADDTVVTPSSGHKE